jgi:hypothetical protein
MALQVVGVPERSFGGYLTRAGKEICLNFLFITNKGLGRKRRKGLVCVYDGANV